MTTTIEINKPANESASAELASGLARNIDTTAFETCERYDGSCLVADLDCNLVIIITEQDDCFRSRSTASDDAKGEVLEIAEAYRVRKVDLFNWAATLIINAEQFLNRLDLTPSRRDRGRRRTPHPNQGASRDRPHRADRIPPPLPPSQHPRRDRPGQAPASLPQGRPPDRRRQRSPLRGHGLTFPDELRYEPASRTWHADGRIVLAAPSPVASRLPAGSGFAGPTLTLTSRRPP